MAEGIVSGRRGLDRLRPSEALTDRSPDMQQTVTASDLSRLPAQHATPTELAQLRAQIVRLEAELALYAL